MKLNITFIIIIGILIFFLIFGHNGILKYQELTAIKNSYELKVKETEMKVEDLNRELELVKKDVNYLEVLIKKDLNMKKPDEDVYILEPKKQPEPKKEEKDKKSE